MQAVRDDTEVVGDLITFGRLSAGNYSWLSNWSTQYPLQIGKWVALTNEHLYQAAKMTTPHQQRQILSARDAYTAKKLGRLGRRQTNWDEIRVEIMRAVVLIRAFQHDDFTNRLLETTSHIIEWTEDDFWGADLKNDTWVGQNKLGQILMQVRDLGWKIRNGDVTFEIPSVCTHITIVDTPLEMAFQQRIAA